MGRNIYERRSLMAKWKEEALVDTKKFDMVSNPVHYGTGNIECIEYIEDFLSNEEYIGYLRGNIAKYLHRWRYKNGAEDLRKSQWYTDRLIKLQESN